MELEGIAQPETLPSSKTVTTVWILSAFTNAFCVFVETSGISYRVSREWNYAERIKRLSFSLNLKENKNLAASMKYNMVYHIFP